MVLVCHVSTRNHESLLALKAWVESLDSEEQGALRDYGA